jgi:hypothetical protein
MTPPLSSSFDLATLNAAQAVATRALRDAVCTWEQEAADAAQRGEYRSAQQYKDWAFAADLAVHQVSGAIGSLFVETLKSMPLVQDTRTVKLPELGRCVNTSTVEVAS